MKARKLLSRDILQVIWLRYSVGVPIRKLHKDFNINMAIPTFTRLIEWYEETTDQEQSVAITDTIEHSLFPAWLNEECRSVQSQPQDWKYIGKFPLGQWIGVVNEDT